MLAQSALWLDKDCPQTRPVHRPAAGKIIMLPEVGALQVSPPIYSRPAIVVRVRHATYVRCRQACGLPCKLPKKLSCPKKTATNRSLRSTSYWQHQCDTEPRAFALDCLKTAMDHIMPKDMHREGCRTS